MDNIEELEQKAFGGDIDSMRALGLFYLPKQSDQTAAPIKTEDAELALMWLGMAIGRNDSSSMRIVGDLYADEKFEGCDQQKATELHEQAAQLGDGKSMLFLARGCEMSKNIDGAESWYVKAADSGEVEAAYRLHEMFSSGTLGVGKDKGKAEKWLQKAYELDSQYTEKREKSAKRHRMGQGIGNALAGVLGAILGGIVFIALIGIGLIAAVVILILVLKGCASCINAVF